MVQIHQTGEADLKNLQELWRRGDVMSPAGFPDGLHETDGEMAEWLRRMRQSRPLADHYSIYEDDVYCGESGYQLDPATGSARLDAKLLPAARGRGLAEGGLTYAVFSAFQAGAERVWASPDPNNGKAVALCRRLGLVPRATPPALCGAVRPNACYMERLASDPPPGGCGGCSGGNCAQCAGR